MASILYVGNVSFDTTQDKLRELFEAYGEVISVNIITDRDTGRSRGFSFVEMATEEAAEKVRMNERELEPLLIPQGREFEEILEVVED